MAAWGLLANSEVSSNKTPLAVVMPALLIALLTA
jgi:hypothetical protein